MILTDNLTESDVDWLVFWARTMLAKDIEDIVPDLNALAELNDDRAITLWYSIFSVGKNVNIDKLVESYPDMTEVEALRQIEELAWDLKYRESQISVKEWLGKIEECNLGLIKSSQQFAPKIQTIKEIKERLTLKFGFFIDPEHEEEVLKNLIALGNAQLEELIEHIGKILRSKTKLKPEYRKILKMISLMEYSAQVKQKIEEDALNLF